MKKISSLVLLIILCVWISSCFPDSCGLFGATSTYSSKLVRTEIPNFVITTKDTLIYKHSDYHKLEYTYTGSESCSGSDYTALANLRSNDIIIVEDSILTFDYIWGVTRDSLRINFIPLKKGITEVLLPIYWDTESTTDDIRSNDTLRFEVQVRGVTKM